jgi:hypothetical protein
VHRDMYCGSATAVPRVQRSYRWARARRSAQATAHGVQRDAQPGANLAGSPGQLPGEAAPAWEARHRPQSQPPCAICGRPSYSPSCRHFMSRRRNRRSITTER